MNMKKLLAIIPILAAVLSSCNGTITEAEVRNHEDPVLAEPESLTLSSASLSLSFEAGKKDSTYIVTESATVNVTINPDAVSWLDYTVDGLKIVVRAKEENPEFTDRTGVITVIVGQGASASSAELSVVQAGAPVPVLKLAVTEVKVGNAAGSMGVSSITETNQESISVSVDEGSSEWCSASISGTVITITAVKENPDTLIERVATVSVIGNRITKTITVAQAVALPPTRVGKPYGTEGIYFWRNPNDPYEYRVVSKMAAIRPWGPKTVAGCPGTSKTAEQACESIRSQPDYGTNYYALQYCDSLGTGWLMPSYADAENLYEVYNGLRYDNKKSNATQAVPNAMTDFEKECRMKFDAVMTSIGGVLLNTQDWSKDGDAMWVCGENTAGDNGWYFRFGKPGYTHGAKTNLTRYVRCVKAVNVKQQ